MTWRELDTVILKHDLPEEGLKRGAPGVVVHCYNDDGIEVEFFDDAGRTTGVVTLHGADVEAPSKGPAEPGRMSRNPPP